MEVTTIIGIVVAVIICLIGLKMIFRKSNDAAPSLDSELHIHEESQKPVIPRHVRDQLQADEATPVAATGRVEPSLSSIEADVASDKTEPQIAPVATAKAAPLTTATEENDAVSTTTNPVEPSTQGVSDQASPITTSLIDDHTSVEENKKIEPEFTLNPNVEAVKIADFDDESNILDVHLHEQQRFDDESALANAEYIISLNMYPNPRKALSGDKTLKVLLKYGLRFGEMNCFHRYESTEHESPLLFSVLRITDEGPAGFDLESLSGEQVQGLAFFLALPHPNVQKGYDSMVSIAGLIARETDGTVYDENNLEFTPQLKEHWRHKAIDYRSSQAV